MSARIEQLLEVIEEVKENFRNQKAHTSIRAIRIKAVDSVAGRRNIEYTTVNDKFIRGLRPHISSVAEFDRLLEGWLRHNSTELQDTIQKHKSDNSDDVLIRNAFHKASGQDILLSEEFGVDPNDIEFREGKEKLKLHLSKERNRHLVKSAKDQWTKESKRNVICSVCSFSFSDTYGKIGKGYIEAHHILPISSITPDIVVKVSDLSPVCSNCHRIIHRYRPWLTINQLKDAIMKVKKNKMA